MNSTFWTDWFTHSRTLWDGLIHLFVGYARTSTIEQEAGFAAQLRDLEQIDCDKIFKEQASCVGTRMELEVLLAFVRQGDTVVVTKLDRLARSVAHLGAIVQRLDSQKVALRILDLGIDTNNATGRLVITMMGGIAEFERSMMLERQREGIAKAKSDGRYKGRKPTARAKADQIRALKAEGASMSAIAEKLGIGKASVHRALTNAK